MEMKEAADIQSAAVAIPLVTGWTPPPALLDRLAFHLDHVDARLCARDSNDVTPEQIAKACKLGECK